MEGGVNFDVLKAKISDLSVRSKTKRLCKGEH